MRGPLTRTTLAAVLLAAGTGALAQSYTVEVTNLTHGNYFTPLLITAHAPGTHLFQVGQTASTSLATMAEGGDISLLMNDLMPLGADTVGNPAGGLLAPGAGTSAMLPITADSNTRLSVVAMILPTNDAFIGLNAVTLPTEPGTYTWLLNGYDAGSEANDEIVNGGGALGTPGIPAAPGGHDGDNGTGVAGPDANPHVHIHRGVLGDTDPNGGPSDLDSRIHRWLNPVARVTVTVQ